MTGRQIRFHAIFSKVQLFPWVRAIGFIPAEPETAELDSLFERARLPQRPFQSRPHAAAAPRRSDPGQVRKAVPGRCWPEWEVPWDTWGTRFLLLLGLSGHPSPAARSSCGTAGLSPTCHLMKGSIYICWEE